MGNARPPSRVGPDINLGGGKGPSSLRPPAKASPLKGEWIMAQPHRPTEIGLVLQGGGALGAYEWGAVTALLELMDNAEAHGRQLTLKVVTGVSIGAINGACIVGSRN